MAEDGEPGVKGHTDWYWDQVGERMKWAEHQTTLVLPRRAYTILRLDGKTFHSFTRGVEKPYSVKLADALDAGALALLGEVMGGRMAYGQSDEYSFLLTDFTAPDTEAWFGGCVQKIVSVAASVFTAAFNQAFGGERLAYFDARCFTLAHRESVVNYFAWRQADAMRNSVSMVASCHFSPRALYGRGTAERREMLRAKGVDWDALPAAVRRGRVVKKGERVRKVVWTHKRTREEHREIVQESYWFVDREIPDFREQEWWLERLIPGAT